MTRSERTLQFIGERPIGRDEVDIFHQLSKISFAEMRLFLQNLMKQGLIDNYSRRVENSRLATIWQITAKGKQTLTGGWGDADHSEPKKSACCHN